MMIDLREPDGSDAGQQLIGDPAAAELDALARRALAACEDQMALWFTISDQARLAAAVAPDADLRARFESIELGAWRHCRSLRQMRQFLVFYLTPTAGSA